MSAIGAANPVSEMRRSRRQAHLRRSWRSSRPQLGFRHGKALEETTVMNSTTAEVFAWVDGRMDDLSSWSATIWDFAEPALREYRSAAWYVDRLVR